MEIDEVQSQQPSRKLPRIFDGRNSQNVEDAGEIARRVTDNGVGTSGGGEEEIRNRLGSWNPSSRIVRVSRASGGKDRHSKVLTSKGLRDRRIRLSVSTAIQFYDLQDRLGVDQPSKAVEWLLKSAAEAISDLPPINAFPDGLSDEKMASNGGNDGQNQNQTFSLSKSAGSSTSETSKNSSALSLSRSEIRGKARERARERTAKDKERENDAVHAPGIQPQSSFTQLLTGGFSSHHDEANPNRQWTSTAPSSAEYFSSVQLIPPASSLRAHQGYNGQFHIGNYPPPHYPPFTISGDHPHPHHHQEPLHGQHLSFVPESLIQTAGAAAAPTADYNTLNFGISSPAVSGGGGGITGYTRGTLQSNSPFLNNIQRFSSSSSSTSSSSPMDTQSVSFFMATPPQEAHNHQIPAGFDGRLYLYYGDGNRSTDHKGKGRN